MIQQLHAASLVAAAQFDNNPQPVPGMAGFQTVIGWSAWVAAGLCVLGLIITGALLGVAYHRGDNSHTGRLGAVLAGCLIVGASSTVVGTLL